MFIMRKLTGVLKYMAISKLVLAYSLFSSIDYNKGVWAAIRLNWRWMFGVNDRTRLIGYRFFIYTRFRDPRKNRGIHQEETE